MCKKTFRFSDGFENRLTISFAENDLSNAGAASNPGCCIDSSAATIVLHLDVRFNEKQIVRSSHFPGVGWSAEQISDHLIGKTLKNPLQRGQPFAIRLTVLQAIFQVHINDELYCTYDHDRPTCGIRYVHVRHDYACINVFAHRQLFPDVYPTQLTAKDADAGCCLAADGRQVFIAEVPHAMHVGTAFTLCGWIAGTSTARFSIDVMANNAKQVLMRFEPRFDQRLVARNAHRLDWQFHAADEERIGVFPFKRGKAFRLTVHVTRECYVFYVNGVYFVHFNHRRMPALDLAAVRCWASEGAELSVQRMEFVRDFVAPPQTQPASSSSSRKQCDEE